MLSVETKLAVAAAFKSTPPGFRLCEPENLRNYILWDMEDYFKHEPEEGSQFNAERGSWRPGRCTR